jgi:hypothetical protein
MNTAEQDLADLVQSHFIGGGVRPVTVKVRSFPGERIVVVEVASQLERAIELGNEIDPQLDDGFVTVRLVAERAAAPENAVDSIRDDRVTRLVGLLDARSRTSEAQPSLRYIEDVAGRLQVATAPRHHLIFGRRGAGKSALMLEARARLEQSGAQTLWLNIQTVRNLGANGAFLTLASRICEVPLAHFAGRTSLPQSVVKALALKKRVEGMLTDTAPRVSAIDSVMPSINALLKLYCTEVQTPIFIFLDDVHYLPYGDTPGFLDRVHSLTRDNPVWLKVAGIRHQMRWFRPEPPTGLQIPHDAIEINLDITLQEPERAKQFLQSVLDGFVEECDAKPRRGFISAPAMDRLILASGAVPRDFVTLCAASIQIARSRANARTTGVQDVNEAAGKAAQAKLQELDEDAAAALGTSAPVLSALAIIRNFALTEHQYSFFRVELPEKERLAEEYALVQRLLDLRILHLINASLSDPHHVGRRSEVYLLDLSEYTGARLKQQLWVLDLEAGHLCLKRTRSTEPMRVGDNARRLVAILRLGPSFSLQGLSGVTKSAVEKSALRKPRRSKTRKKKA